jgi:signal transduction histidine kinase/CheY-like chemotaxis protein
LIKRFWSKLSISNKLYVVIGVMAFLVASELLTLWFAMNIMSGVRSFVTGESLWSKAQKEAVISLHEYARTRDPRYRKKFFEHYGVIYGDRIARRELLENKNPDLELVRQGFYRGKLHPEDVEGIIVLLSKFSEISYIKTSVKVWTLADGMVDEIAALGEEVHKKVLLNVPRGAIASDLGRIDAINSELTDMEALFSSSMGDGSRWLQHFLLVTLSMAVLLVESTGLGLTISLSRSLTRRLRELNDAATKLSEGNLEFKVPVRSGDELGVMAETLNKMAADLKSSENASRLKSLFLANMSHEMRTPLGAILGFAKLLQEPSLTRADRAQYISIIEKTGESLTKIINDILDLSKVEAGYLEIEKSGFSLYALLKEVRLMCETKIGKKHVQVLLSTRDPLPDFIYTDPQRLQQILMNILGNAIKFTERGQVRILCEAQAQHLIFSITDTGVGIAADKQKLLFKTFSQVDSSLSRRHEGTGLGLVLSRHLARMLGGDVILSQSDPGAGSTFTVTIPFEIPVEARDPQSAEEKKDSIQGLIQGRSVLLVDDSEINRLLIQRILSKQGMLVTMAVNGQEAVEMALAKNYDMILMDVQMPIMDGRAATQSLRAQGYRLPIIALTAHAMKEDRDKCIEAGCNDYLTKPVQFEMLFTTMAKYLSPEKAAPRPPESEI